MSELRGRYGYNTETDSNKDAAAAADTQQEAQEPTTNKRARKVEEKDAGQSTGSDGADTSGSDTQGPKTQTSKTQGANTAKKDNS